MFALEKLEEPGFGVLLEEELMKIPAFEYFELNMLLFELTDMLETF